MGLCGFTLLFGRFFGGYACAFGTLGDAVYWLSGLVQTKLLGRKKRFCLPRGPLRWGQKIKYVLLTAIVLLCALGLYQRWSGWSPWSVFSLLTALHPLSRGDLAGVLLLGLILVGMGVQERFFCQCLCPMGAVFTLLPLPPFAQLHRTPAQCLKGCSACQRNCPVDVKLEPGGIRNGECICCERCAGICPRANLTRWDRRLFREELVGVLLRCVGLMALGAWMGVLRWHG